MLEARNLTCTRAHRTLFTQLDFKLGPGEVLVVEGKNGSGKSTLLKMLSGLRRPDAGEVVWQGRPLDELATEFNRQLNWLGHRNGINESLTAKENLQITSSLAMSANNKFNEALARVGLAGYANTPARHFSAGMKRRLALARFLVKKASLWVMDEPEVGLDKNGMALFDELVAEHVSDNGLVVMSSHHEVRFADSMIQRLAL